MSKIVTVQICRQKTCVPLLVFACFHSNLVSTNGDIQANSFISLSQSIISTDCISRILFSASVAFEVKIYSGKECFTFP